MAGMISAAMKHLPLALLIAASAFAAACGGSSSAGTPDAGRTAAPADPGPSATPPAPIGKAPDATAPSAPATAAPAGGTSSASDLAKVLGGITDETTAKAAKPALDSILASLQSVQNLVGGAAQAGTAAPATAGGLDLAKAAGAALSRVGVGADTVQQIQKLLQDPAIKGAIGATLEALLKVVK
jgi:hypothetical protein